MAKNRWKIAYASVIGTSHLEKEIGCQDCFDHRIVNTSIGETLIVAMADGAGSSPFSRIGAEKACSLFIGEIETLLLDGEEIENLNKDFGKLFLNAFQSKIADLAEEQEKNVRDYASTFIGAVVWDNGAVFYQVGDGGVIYSSTGESESYCFGILPSKKIYANATDFITDETAEERLLYEFVNEPITDLIIFTDGIERIAVNIQAGLPHEPFLIPMLEPLHKEILNYEQLNKKLEAFLNSPRINEKTDDDKTLFLASRYIQISIEGETDVSFDEPKNENQKNVAKEGKEVLEIERLDSEPDNSIITIDLMEEDKISCEDSAVNEKTII